jgi:hypothetical protein
MITLIQSPLDNLYNFKEMFVRKLNVFPLQLPQLARRPKHNINSVLYVPQSVRVTFCLYRAQLWRCPATTTHQNVAPLNKLRTAAGRVVLYRRTCALGQPGDTNGLTARSLVPGIGHESTNAYFCSRELHLEGEGRQKG